MEPWTPKIVAVLKDLKGPRASKEYKANRDHKVRPANKDLLDPRELKASRDYKVSRENRDLLDLKGSRDLLVKLEPRELKVSKDFKVSKANRDLSDLKANLVYLVADLILKSNFLLN